MPKTRQLERAKEYEQKRRERELKQLSHSAQKLADIPTRDLATLSFAP